MDGVGDQPVVVARVVKPHGIHGELVLRMLSDLPDRLAAGVRVRIGQTVTTVLSVRWHQGRLLVALEGVGDRSAAELLRGQDVQAAAVPLDEHDTYFAHELVGAAVIDEQGRDLGRVCALVELPDAAGYDLLEVARDDGSTWLLPAVDDYVEVEEHDHDRCLRVVDPPPGLLDP